MLGNPQKKGGNGFLKKTCPTNLLLAVRHVLRISAAERLAAPLPTHCLLKAQSRQLFIGLQHSHSLIAQLRAQSLYCNKSWRPQLRDKTLCFSAWDWCFSSVATKGWAWCNHNAELVERTVALRNLKLLVESGCLETPPKKAAMDSVQQISFWQSVTFCEYRQLKGWQPRFQPAVC